MAFERKRFCFNLKCNVTEDEYKDESNFKNGTYENGEKTKFKICTNCFIADFCGKTCQEQAKYFIPKITYAIKLEKKVCTMMDSLSKCSNYPNSIREILAMSQNSILEILAMSSKNYLQLINFLSNFSSIHEKIQTP